MFSAPSKKIPPAKFLIPLPPTSYHYLENPGTEGRIDLLHRILMATARGLTSTTAVEWYLKVKDMDYCTQSVEINQFNSYTHS